MTAVSEIELESLYVASRDKYVKSIRNMMGSVHSAEDAVQEAFCRALKYWKSFDGDNIQGWFWTILRNAARDIKKEDRLDGMTTGSDEEEGTDILDEIMFRNEVLDLIEEDINQYTGSHRVALKCAIMYQWLPQEIAKITDLTATHIAVIVHRFKQEMRDKYGAEMCI